MSNWQRSHFFWVLSELHKWFLCNVPRFYLLVWLHTLFFCSISYARNSTEKPSATLPSFIFSNSVYWGGTRLEECEIMNSCKYYFFNNFIINIEIIPTPSSKRKMAIYFWKSLISILLSALIPSSIAINMAKIIQITPINIAKIYDVFLRKINTKKERHIPLIKISGMTTL